MKFGKYLGLILKFMIFRFLRKEVLAFPYLIALFYSNEDRDFIANCKTIRGYFHDIIKVRKTELEKGIGKDETDVLTLLLK
jgi:hypothetical protein